MKNFVPITTCEYGPLDRKVTLQPDFFTGFVPEKRREIVSKEAQFYHSITEPYSVDHKLEKKYITVKSFDGVDIQVKVYRPLDAKGPLPAFLFAHGGGYMTCSVETHDFVPSYIAANANVVAFSVEYRLAPEYQYPIGIKDCYEVLRWIVKHAAELGVDKEKLSVGGDSSGGHFAIALTLMARELGDLLIDRQVLIYPVTDLSGTVKKRSAEVYTMVGSSDDNDQTGNPLFDVFAPPGTDPKDPLISPLFADDYKRLPKALFIQAECDALLDDGLMYAKCLQDAGVPVQYHIYKGMPHAFILRTYDETFDALGKICAFLNA